MKGGGGVSRFSVEKFSSQCPIFPRANIWCSVSEIFRWRKSLWIKGGDIKTFRRKNFHSQCRKTSQGNPFLFHYFQVSKYVRDKRRGEHQDFPRKNFRLMVPNISYCNPFVQCFRNFPVAKNFMDKGVYQVSPSKLFSLTVPKNFAGESFTVYYFQVSKNVKDKRRG